MTELAVSPSGLPRTRRRRLHRLRTVIALGLGLAFLLGGAWGVGVAHAEPETEETVSITGTLRNDGEPVAGVSIDVEDDSGATVGTVESGDNGRWEIDLPPGRYSVVLNSESLPDGVEVQNDTVAVTLEPGRNRPVIFSFGEPGEGAGTSAAVRLTRLAIDGLRFGLIIAITGVGLSLIFGTTSLTNFAHGDLVTLGAVIAWVINVSAGLHLIPATLIAIVVGVGVGMLGELAIWRRLRNRRSGLIAQLVVSIGLSLILRYLMLMFFSDRAEPLAQYTSQTQIGSGAFAISPVNLACIIISIVVLLMVALMLQKTRIGKAMRAVADNRDLAASSGINVDRVILFVWGLAGGLATLGGVLFALSELGGRVQWEMGFKLLLLMFAGVTLGGLGTAYGALLGCIIVGMMVQMSTYWLAPDLKYVGGLIILIVILTIRPQGILGSKARIG